RMDELDMRLSKAISQKVDQQRLKTEHLSQRLATQSPRKSLASAREQVLRLDERLHLAIRQHLKQQQERLQFNAQTLNVVSPLATLGRGYAIVKDDQDRIVRDAAQLAEGQTIHARLGRGSVSAKVTEVNFTTEYPPPAPNTGATTPMVY